MIDELIEIEMLIYKKFQKFFLIFRNQRFVYFIFIMIYDLNVIYRINIKHFQERNANMVL